MNLQDLSDEELMRLLKESETDVPSASNGFDSLSDEQLAAKLKEAKEQADSGKPTQEPNATSTTTPTEGKWTDRFHSIMDRLQTGGNDPLIGYAQNIAHEMPGVPDEITKGVDLLVKGREQAYDKAHPEEGFDVPRVAGSALTSLAMGNPRSVAGSIMNGMVDGFNQPWTGKNYLTDKLIDAGIGGTFGGGIHSLGAAISSFLNPKMANDLKLQELKDAGVLPSFGQATGDSWVNRMEEKMAGLPWLGDAIRDLRRRGLESWNEATLNKAIEPIGTTITDFGRGGLAQTNAAAHAAYDKALDGIGDIPWDRQGWGEYNDWVNRVGKLRDAKVQDAIITPIEHGVDTFGINGPNYKNLDSHLGKIEDKYRYSPDGTMDVAADYLGKYSDIIRDQLGRAFPGRASMLDDADKAWAGYKRVEDAANMARNNGGVFSPAQLMSAIYHGDKSGSRKALGDSMLQDWADIGNTYIRDKVPDSGTAGRALAMAMDPGDSLGLAIAANSDIGGVSDALLSLMSNRTDWMRKAGKKGKDLTRLLDELAGGGSQEYLHRRR